jgi:superfamily I DNA/RNA helicase
VSVKTGGRIQHWGALFQPERVISGLRKDELTENDSIMIIGQTNYQLTQVRQDLESHGVPVSYKGKAVNETPEARNFYWYHKARKGSDVPITHAVGLVKSLQLPAAKALADEARIKPDRMVSPGELGDMGVRFISSSSSIAYLSRDSKRSKAVNSSLWAMAVRFGLDNILQRPRISLQTFHSCKGREADHTIIMTDSSPRAMEYAQRNPDYEQRLAYVGVTRTKKQANIVENESPYFMKAFRYV